MGSQERSGKFFFRSLTPCVVLSEACLYSAEWNSGIEWWNGMEWMTTPTEHVM
jgi:hypothetical protein